MTERKDEGILRYSNLSLAEDSFYFVSDKYGVAYSNDVGWERRTPEILKTPDPRTGRVGFIVSDYPLICPVEMT